MLFSSSCSGFFLFFSSSPILFRYSLLFSRFVVFPLSNTSRLLTFLLLFTLSHTQPAGSRGASGTTATSDRRGSVPERSSSGGNKVPGLVGLVRGPLPPRGDGVWRTQARTATTASQPPASATRSVSGGSGAPALASSTASNATVTVRRVVSANAAHGTGSPGRPPAGRSVTLGQRCVDVDVTGRRRQECGCRKWSEGGG